MEEMFRNYTVGDFLEFFLSEGRLFFQFGSQNVKRIGT